MSEQTVKEIETWILKDVNNPEDDNWDFWPNAGYGDDFLVREVPGIGKIEIVDWQHDSSREVAGEYMGDYTEWKIWVVFKIPDGRVFRLNGVTSSWDSDGFTDIEEVEQVEKTIIVWEKKHDY